MTTTNFHTPVERNPIAETNGCDPASCLKETGKELEALQKSEKVLRNSYDGLNRMMEAQSKEFQAVLNEREAVLNANKALSARISELELQIKNFAKEGKSVSREHQEPREKTPEQIDKTEAIRKEKPEREKAAHRADCPPPERQLPELETAHRRNTERDAALSELNGQIDILIDQLAIEKEARKIAELALVKLRQPKQPKQTPTMAAEPLPKGDSSVLQVPITSVNFIRDLVKPGTGVISSKLKKSLVAMHRSLPFFVRHTNDVAALSELCRQIGIIHEETTLAGILPLHQMATTLRMMLEDFRQKPSLMVHSSLSTVGQAFDLMILLSQKGNINELKSLAPANILAVDDDGDVLAVLESQLGSLGLNLHSCTDPNEALPTLQRQQFDLVLLDIGMADHNGFELCSHIRKLEGYLRIPVVFLTGLTTAELRDQATLVGGNDFVSKPFHGAELALKCIFWAFKARVMG